MPSSPQQCVGLLKEMGKMKSKRKFLKKCPIATIKTLCECALNLLQGNIPISNGQKKRLTPHKRSLRKLADKKLPLFKKRALLVQRGDGFLGFLLPAAISALTTLINGI